MHFPVANPLREETRMHFSAATLLPKESVPARDPPSLAPRNCTSAQPSGCLAAYFPETNPLVALESVADGSNTPASKSIVVTLQVSG